MTYCLDLMRAVVYAGTPDYERVVLFNPAICGAAIVALTVVFLVVGTVFFARSEAHK
jgi:ABC-2 type transport system permease protein